METSKIKKGKSKTTYFFFFILNLSKWKKFSQFWFSKRHLSSIQIFKKIIDKGSSPKVWSNSLSLWLSYDWLLPLKFSSSRISYCTISYWFQKVFFLFLRYLSFSEFDASSWNYPSWIFSGLTFCAAYIRTFEFSNVKIDKRISQRVRSYYSYKLRLLHELRDTNLSYLSKDKEYKK